MYNLHQIFLTIANIINLATVVTSGIFCFKNLNSNLKKEVTYSSLGIFTLSFIIMCLLITYTVTKKLLFFKYLIAFYVFLTINIGIFVFFSFYDYKVTDHLNDHFEMLFGIMIASFGISLLFFLLSDQFLLKKIDKGLGDEDIEMDKFDSKIIEYSRMYGPERKDYIYVETSTLKTIDNEYYNIIELPTRVDKCNIKLLRNDCFFKDSDLFKKDGTFSTKRFNTMGINKKYKNQTLKEILDKFFEDVVYQVKNGNTVAFPKGEWQFEKCPLITKYVDNYKDYLLLLSETYGEDLSLYFNSNVLLTAEAIYKIKPDLNSIRDERIEERRNKFVSMAAKSQGMDECDFISSVIGKRKGKHDDDLIKFMMTLVKDLDCHDEKKLELAKNLSVNNKSVLEAKMKVNKLRNVYHAVKK